MPLLDPTDPRPVHFVGIAGAGMSALAELVARRGARVSGCDASPTHVEDLERVGIPVLAGHDPSHVEGARALVITSAMRRDHPELTRAHELGIPVIRRAEALGEVTRGGDMVGIAGTHGKTTTTVMTTEALAGAGLDPTGVAGGRVGRWGGNLRPGSNRLFVVESDEYDRSFLALSPTVAVVTNVEADHLDIYADLADIRRAFEHFVGGARTIVLCADDQGANTLRTPAHAEVIRYGVTSRDARLVATALAEEASGSSFTVTFDGESLGEVTLAVTGRHNVLNALAAIGAAIALKATVPAVAPGLGAFPGVERRFQRLGDVGGVLVIDDYAHHPTEIRATLDAARSAFPGRRIVAAFQPHLFTRTRDFFEDFGSALATADAAFLTEIYPAREQPIAGVSAQLIADAVTRSGGSLAWRGSRSDLASALAGEVREGDVVLTLGAGDITLTGPELLGRLSDGS